MKANSRIALTPEETVLLLTCRPTLSADDDRRIAKLVEGSLEWDQLLWRAENLRTIPLLRHHLGRAVGGEAIPDGPSAYLDAWTRVSRARSQLMFDELRRLVAMFDDAGVNYFLIKGGALAPLVYPDPLLRPMLDLDVVVDPAQVGYVKQLMYRRGYQHAYWDADSNVVMPVASVDLLDYQEPHYELPIFLRIARDHLDVPPAIVPRSWRRKHLKVHIASDGTASFPLFVDIHLNLSIDFELDDIWRGAAREEVLGRPTPVQSPTGMVWFLAARLYHEAFQHNTLKLSMLGDVHAIVDRLGSTIDWDDLIRVCHKYGMQAAVFYVLAQVHRLTRAPVPPEVLDELRPDRLEWPAGHDWGDLMPKLLGRVVLHDIALAGG
jgi:hypothetical protein